MNMLTSYDQALGALSAALSSKDIAVVMKGRADLDLIKLRARQLRDRQLLADATEFQMRVERWLGELLKLGVSEGYLARRGGRYKDAREKPATLGDIGVDAKLSMKAQRAAGLEQSAFDAAVSEMRARMAAGRAKLVKAVDDAQKSPRRSSTARGKYLGLSFPLSDKTRLGNVKLGALRSRIARLAIEMKILEAISQHAGSSADALASVEDTISEALAVEIVKRAGRQDD